MSRSKWSVVFALLTALGLLFCQNVARGEESETAPQPPDGSSPPAQKTDVLKDARLLHAAVVLRRILRQPSFNR